MTIGHLPLSRWRHRLGAGLVLVALAPANDPDTFTARVLVGGKIEERRVKIGARDRLNGEVLSGLKEGEALVTGIRRDKASGRLQW